MHCTSYLSGRYYARDLISEASGIPWPQLNSDITGRSGTGYNVSLQQSLLDHHMGYVKEVMKQAMLKHEAVFRYQVHELHRLYRRQKELINEFQRRYIQLQMPQQDPITYPVKSVISQKPMNDVGWPSVGGTGYDPSVLSAEKLIAPLHCEQLDTNSSSKIENGQKELKVFPPVANKSGKRILDLELPADQYIDSDEENNVEENVELPQIHCYPPKETSGFDNDSKLSSFHKIGSPSLNSGCGRRICLLDLNEPFRLEELDVLNSPSHVESATCYVETIHMDRHQSQKAKKESEILDGRRDHTIQVGKDIDACSKIVHPEERQLEAFPHNSEADGATLNTLEQVSSSERTMLRSELSKESDNLPVDVHPKTPGPCIFSSHQLVPQSAESRTKASCSISSRRNHMQDLGKIHQALPCFNNPNLLDKGSKSTSESSRDNRDIFHAKKNSASDPSSGNVNSYPNSSDDDPTSEVCSPSKRIKNSDNMTSSVVDMDLNCMPPRWSSEVVAAPENDGNRDDEHDTEDVVKVLGWQRKSCIDGDILGSPGLAKSSMLDAQSSAIDPACCVRNPFKVKDIENNVKVGKIDSPAASEPMSLSVECSKSDLDVGTGTGNNFPRCKASIQLNSCTKEDEPSPDSTESDLDAPVSPENKECCPPRGESENLQLEIPLLFSKDHQRVEELDRIAAEAIISMSSSGIQLHVEAVTRKPSKLEWFAGVVSSVAENLENGVEELLDSDYFEASELKLREIKVEDICYRSKKQNDEETADDFLPTRRGCGRRARQPRGFKKKALHTLGVLSTAAGAALDNVTKRKRNMGNNGLAKRRLHLNTVHCRGLEQFMSSPSLYAAKSKDGGRLLGGWGLTKGQRTPRRARNVFDDFPLADF